MSTGSITARPPHSTKSYVRAVVDDIRFRRRVVSPLPATNGGRPHPPCNRTAPNLFPRRKCNRTVIADCRALDLGSGAPPRRVLGGGTGGASLLCRAAVLLQFGLTLRGKFGDYALRQGSKRRPVLGALHGFNHGATDEREAVKHSQG